MGITRDEFSQFKEWMQERHDEVMSHLRALPCKEHEKQIKKFGKAMGYASGLGAIVGGLVVAAIEKILK